MFRPLIAIAALGLSGLAMADDACSVTVHGTDQMMFDTTSIAVPASCKQFTVTLEHPGDMPKNVMGHNWVLTRAADMQAVDDDGSKAGEANNYVQPGDKRVLAHTKLIGAKEQDSVTFDTALLKKDEQYAFFCSFPFHAVMMKGTLTFGS